MQIITQIGILFVIQVILNALFSAGVLILSDVFILQHKPPAWVNFLTCLITIAACLAINTATLPGLIGIAIAPFISTSDLAWNFLFGDKQ